MIFSDEFNQVINLSRLLAFLKFPLHRHTQAHSDIYLISKDDVLIHTKRYLNTSSIALKIPFAVESGHGAKSMNSVLTDFSSTT